MLHNVTYRSRYSTSSIQRTLEPPWRSILSAAFPLLSRRWVGHVQGIQETKATAGLTWPVEAESEPGRDREGTGTTVVNGETSGSFKFQMLI